MAYSSLSVIEKWEWHANDYAFRIVVLGEPWEGLSSPCDPNREWFDFELIRQAVARKRQEQHVRQDWNRKEAIEAGQQDRWRRAAEKRGQVWISPRDLQRQGREINERYARANGYADWDACWDANANKEGLAVKIITWMKAEGIARRPGVQAPRSTSYTAGDLGVSAAPAKIEIPEGQADYLKAELAKRLGKATGEAAE